jgi:sulfopyruvate decarboxylase subunit beta
MSTPRPSAAPPRMPLVAALEVIHRRRSSEIVVTTMGAAREWWQISQHPLDLNYYPSAMGQGPSLALGLALARPDREVIVFNGDGSLLMNLGSLVTVVASGATNLTLIVIDNGVYEVTGSQRTAGAVAGVDFAAMARAAGFPSVERFDNLDDWQRQAAAVLKPPGPRFVVLATEAVRDNFNLHIPEPIAMRLERFINALRQ